MKTANQPLPVQPAPEIVDAELAPLLAEPFAAAWPAGTGAPPALRDRLAARVQATQAAEAGMRTTRRRRAPREPLAPGVTRQTLYRAEPGAALRAGEPLQALLLELAPGAALPAAAADGRQREWLLLAGHATLDGESLALRDFHWRPAGSPQPALASPGGALVFVRESALAARPGDAALTVRDAEAGWPAFAPGIRRRVLWQRDGQAALLYHADPGAAVPQHTHGHDEECLMVQGELFLDDLLLQAGDYQLAPAGTGHRVTQTDTGVVIYAHGDADLRFV
jgi:quercetin dioxygenase-like cupin family protein